MNAALAVGIAWLLSGLFRSRVSWRALWLPALLAVFSHIFCDLWTSYGTRVWWPFSDARVALDWVAVVDPLLTVPLILLTVLELRRVGAGKRLPAMGLVWVAAYLSLAAFQHGRATRAVETWLADQGASATERLTVKPSFANIIVWRAMIKDASGVRVAAVRCGWGASQILGSRPSPVAVYPSAQDAAQAFDIAEGTAQFHDLQRFYHFSDHWVGVHPGHPTVLGDLRYATLPDEILPLWGIELRPGDSRARVTWRQFPANAPGAFQKLWALITTPPPGEPKPPA